MAEDFDLESLVHVEQTFYNTGYQDGYQHGRIHGLIEGRALGREKGYEMWEELGFYEGFASTWKTFCVQNTISDDRILNNIDRLLDLISQFPTFNPSVTNTTSDLDIPQLFGRIRSRYKALCSILGVRPTLRAAEASGTDQSAGGTMDTESDSLREPRSTVWSVEGSTSRKGRPITNEGLTY